MPETRVNAASTEAPRAIPELRREEVMRKSDVASVSSPNQERIGFGKKSLLRRQEQIDDAMSKLEYVPPETRQRIQVSRDVLKNGEEPLKTGVQEGMTLKRSANMTRVMKFEKDGETRAAVVKERVGSIQIDAEGYPVKWRAETQTYARIPERKKDGTVADMGPIGGLKEAKSDSYVDAATDAYCTKLRITDPEKRASLRAYLKNGRSGIRFDQPGDGEIVREMAASQLNDLLQMNVIPTTVARVQERLVASPDGLDEVVEDLASAQQFVEVSEKGAKPRELYKEEFEVMWHSPPAEWASKLDLPSSKELEDSLTQLGCLDWLTGAQDRHFGNMLFDPKTLKASGIDNALIFGMQRGIDVTPADPGKKAAVEDFKAMRSVPLEFMQRYAAMKLSEEMQGHFKRVYDGILKGGPEKTAVEEVFKALFDHPAVAKKQMVDFIARLKHLADNGRPPAMEALSPDSVHKPGEKYNALARFGKDQPSVETKKAA